MHNAVHKHNMSLVITAMEEEQIFKLNVMKFK